jgi:threonylcarbamoyladenosine tRNA methylthiotransferase CDKAL1
VLAGCVPSGDKSIVDKFKDVSMLHVTQLDRIIDVVEEASKGHTVQLLKARSDLPSLELPKVKKDKLSELITINAGCLGNCTYCKTKFARGKVVSYSVDEICARARAVAAEGVRHVELASEDMGAYGVDIGTNIAELLLRLSDALLHDFPGVMIRTGMTNPPYIMQHLDGIIEALQRPNVYAFMHLPVQSGSNEVLTAMRREYTVEDFSYVVDRLTSAIPDIYIVTDIICGFPYESAEDWADTMTLVRKYKFAGVYCSRFFSRPGTPAAKMKQLKPKVAKERHQELLDFIQHNLPNKNAMLADTQQRVWFTGTDDRFNQTVGRTKNYTRCVVEKDEALIGRNALVHITETTVKHVTGKVVGELS